MERRGEITVFLSMILLCVAGLLCVMLESARTAGARWYLQAAAGSSIDSLFSQYHRQLWQEYHLLGLEYESEAEMADRLQGFLDSYMETENWYPMAAEEVRFDKVQRLSEEGGLWLETEILDYMKYGIWSQLDIKPEEGARFFTDIREAASMKSVTEAYGKQSGAAWDLEKTLEKIYQCLARQKEHQQKAARELAGENSSGFYGEAGRLEKEIQKIPGLVAAYEKQADRLKKEIEKLEGTYADQSGGLREDMKITLGQELEQYRAYVQEDGERRQQITGLKALGDANSLLISDVRSRVAAIEAYIDSLTEEEDDDSGAMWESARAVWSGFRDSGLVAGGEKQEAKRGWLVQIQKMADSGLLELVIPSDREVSTAAFDLARLPSAGKGGGETDKKNLLNRVLVNEYCSMHFTDFLTMAAETGDSVEEDGEGGQQYGMEYLLGGKGSDRENLAETVKKLLVVREGMNLMYLFSDSQKRQEARTLALGITGALGLTPLVEITAVFILGIWALGEAVMDIRTLLSGGKVPLIKRREEWNLGLEQLLELGKNGMQGEGRDRDSGLSYQGYMKLMLLAEESERKYYRMMDMIQMKLQRKQTDFQIDRCVYRVDSTVAVCGKHVFFSLPLVENLTGNSEHRYTIQAAVGKAY